MSLILIEPTRGRVAISHDSAVLVTGAQGFLDGDDREQGLFVYETRFLSRWHWRVRRGGGPLERVVGSPVEQDTWMGYFVTPVRRGVDPAQDTLELVLRRTMRADGMREEAAFTNFGREPARAVFDLELDADFRDQTGLRSDVRRLRGETKTTWRELADGALELTIDWRATHTYVRRWDVGRARLHRTVRVRFEGHGCTLRRKHDVLRVHVKLAPHAQARVVADVVAHVDEPLEYPVHRGQDGAPPFAAQATCVEVPGSGSLAPVVAAAVARATDDLAALRLSDFDGTGGWVPAAGVPTYLSLFGRDSMIGGLQAAMLGTEPLAGALDALACWQGRRDDPWHDEWPGRVVHEVHASPLSVAQIDPHSRYYGSLTASAMYALALAELWSWTGDRARVEPLVDAALAGLHWMDTHGDLDGDGFYEYERRSPRGLKNQGWKDSSDAIVHADGREAEPPIATCEAQGYTFLAKVRMSQLLAALGRGDEAGRLAREASELQKRFVDAFWLDDVGYVAMGLDRRKRPIRSIASDPGHCLAAGILPPAIERSVADRLLEPDMFSGWGVRTLSANHPAFDPYSYHRGSVWPVEQGTIALGLALCGLHEHATRIAHGTFDAAALFAYQRLPEVMSGHARDEGHPFPAVYPRTCWPQAWSASAVVALVRALVGLVPSAHHRRLFVDAHLPPWLPELTLRALRVGWARVDIRFRRLPDGSTTFDVLDLRGSLDVVHRHAPEAVSLATRASVHAP